MSRKRSIKWRDRDEEELKRVVRNFNSKLNRILKKNPELAEYLPERKDPETIKKNINTRSQFNNELKSMNRFNLRSNRIRSLGEGQYEGIETNKNGLKITSWEKKEIGIQVAVINRARTKKRKQIENLEITSRGKNLNIKRSEMKSVRLNELKNKEYNFDSIKKSDWKKYKATVKRQMHPDFQSEADYLLRDNYIKGLIEVFGNTEETEKLIEQIKAMNIDDFITKFYKEQEADIDFIYDPLEADRKFKILYDVWNNEDISDKQKSKLESKMKQIQARKKPKNKIKKSK